MSATDDLALFNDWCIATGRQPREPSDHDLHAFSEAISSAPGTLKRRLQTILHSDTSQKPPEARCAPAWDVDRSQLSVSDSLSRCPSAGWPGAYSGRRDAWLLVLLSPTQTGGLGLTRGQAVGLQPKDVSLDLTVDDDPTKCPKCVAVRWLHVVGLEHRFGRSSVRSFTSTVSAVPHHVCDREPDPEWRTAWTLAPAIDRHGWATDWRPMTTRAVTTVLRQRRDLAAPLVVAPTRSGSATQTQRIRSKATVEELLDDLDVVGAAADELNARISALLDDTDNMLRQTRRRR